VLTGVPPATLAAVVAALVGLAAGVLVSRLAASFPWRAASSLAPASAVPAGAGTPEAPTADAPIPGAADAGAGAAPAGRAGPVPTAVLAVGTAALSALAAVRFGASPELPAFLALAAAGVLLAVLDLRHHLLPNRVVLPALAAGVVLLTGAAALTGAWSDLLRAAIAAAVLFAVYLVMALISPSSLGMGDVKLAALLGLHLGWLGWPAVGTGAVAGFVVQALVGLVLLASRRIGLRSDLPFGPAMLIGAALAIGGADSVLG
jgi:leader peptidase (prepilin peptidase)/N-methyltransferase